MPVQLILNSDHKEVEEGSSLFQYAESMGFPVPTSCHNQGKCKECIIEVVKGMELLSERTLHERHLQNNFRLSCQTKIQSDNGVIECRTMRRGQMKIVGSAIELPAWEENIVPEPCVTRSGDRILLDGKEIARSSGGLYGIAMDLGTTTVVLRLIDLETGVVVANSSFENPQRFGGSDIMARIQYDTEHRGKLLQRTLAGYITHAIEEFPVDPTSIYEMVVAGNSTMRDLFFRMNVYSIGQSPYRSITELEMEEGKRLSTVVTANARQLLLPIHPNARVYGMPIISGHVGADAAACMLAVDLSHEERTVAIMDIGTNTELIVGNKNRIIAASCPAGPAFEGGKIRWGMPGLSGAIERVRIQDDGSAAVQVIDALHPQGICGSGLIDTLSELLRTGYINQLGRFESDEHEFILYSDHEKSISLSENDINELAQAKGANVAGLHVAFKRFGLHFEDIDLFYLAGGFGRHVDITSSKRMGLIPNIDDSKIVQVGNASIEGASIALVSRSKRLELEEMVKKVIHCRLETDPNFFDYFVEGCQFKPVNSLHQVGT